MRIDLFFGAGGAYFGLPKPQYAILNDLDDDVFNLYMVIKSNPDELHQALEQMPVSSSLLKHWKANQETDPIQKALRFVFLSNFSLLGKGDTLRLGFSDPKKVVLSDVKKTFTELGNAKITNYDFREVIPKVEFSDRVCRKSKAFVYLDPVYLETSYTYKVPKWTKDDTIDCLDIMASSGIKCAMSEFDHPLVLEEANRRGFRVIPIVERRNINNRRCEILIANYDNDLTIW